MRTVKKRKPFFDLISVTVAVVEKDILKCVCMLWAACPKIQNLNIKMLQTFQCTCNFFKVSKFSFFS